MKSTSLLLFLTACSVFLLFACRPDNYQDEPGLNVTEQQPFFDLSNYFQKEQVRLSALRSSFTKKATVNGKEETKVFESLDFEKELAMFIDSDINKVAWLDKYEVDSTLVNGQLKTINYSTPDQSLKTQALSIHFDREIVSQVDILRKSTSIAANVKQELTYKPALGYSIISTQNTKLSDPEVIELEVRF